MITPDLPGMYQLRPLRRDDAQPVVDLMTAYEQRVLGEPLIELADLEAEWQRPSTDLDAMSTAVFSGDRLVAYAEVTPPERCEACVHPDVWGLGIGTALVRWSRAVARESGLEQIGQTLPDADLGARRLFRRHGYRPRFSSWILALPGDATVPAREPPAGYALRDFVPGQDERAAYTVIEDAFSEWPDRPPQSYEDWAAEVLGRTGFAPWMLRLVEAPDGDVVGACLLQLNDDTGFVSRLAVARPQRGQGLAQAMLADAFASARRHGRPRAELSTDSRTGALGLYERVGMQVTMAFTRWARTP